MTTDPSQTRRTLWLLLSLVSILVGLVAIVAPMAAGLGATIVVGWLIMLSGGSHVALAFEPQRLGSRAWHALAGLSYLIGGIIILLRPDVGLISLTLLLAAMFLAGGVFRLAAAFALRTRSRALWLFADAILTLLLGALIYLDWPGSSHWLIGTFVGVTLVFNGAAGLAFSLAVRGRPANGSPTGHVPIPETR